MTPSQRRIAEEIATFHVNGLTSRREALRRLALLGMGTAAASALIAACAEEKPPDTEPPGAAPPTSSAAKGYVDSVGGASASHLEVVTPEDFGAVGDGVTDDTDALDEMFNSYTVSNGGSCILIPYGKVYATNALDIKDNTFVFGGGTLKCLSDDGGTGNPGAFMLFKNAVRNVTWIGPTLDINELL